MRVLVTGGAGYIGSHTCVVLLERGDQVAIVDNLCNSKKTAVDRIEELTGKQAAFYQADVRDREELRRIFEAQRPDAVIHFAGLKAVSESVSMPLKYYQNNLVSTMTLLEVMEEFGVGNFVFSSSATVYGNPKELPITEESPTGGTTNPYGTTKLFIERILMDYAAAHPSFHPVLLRYFNPVGAHPSGRLGEDPNGVPANLTPYITQVAVGKREYVHVNGDDYPTPDGTGVRDYIHVMDLAEGHVAALRLFEREGLGPRVYNLGTGRGYSVLEMIAAFSKAVGKEIPYRIEGRRPGDIPACYADCSKAEREMGWKASRGIDEMCADAWRWQRMNPNGFEE